MNLYEKIQHVSNKIKNLEKDMIVGNGAYSYKAVSDIQVTLAVKEAETEFKVLSIPVKQELLNSEVLKKVNKQGDESFTFVDTIKMTVRIQDLEKLESFIDIESFGKGIDSGDKGFGKASTYARKYALLNAYKIATGEDPDSEKSGEQTAPKQVSEKKKLVMDYLEMNTELCVELCKHFSVGEISDLNDAQIETIYKSYKKKKLI